MRVTMQTLTDKDHPLRVHMECTESHYTVESLQKVVDTIEQAQLWLASQLENKKETK